MFPGSVRYVSAAVFVPVPIEDVRGVQTAIEPGGGPDRSWLQAAMFQGQRLLEVRLAALATHDSLLSLAGASMGRSGFSCQLSLVQYPKMLGGADPLAKRADGAVG